MLESEQKFFQKFILKKNLGGLLKFSIFDENSHFLSIQHSRLTLKELQLQTPATIPTFGQHRVKIPTEKFIKIFVYMWNSDRGEFKFKIQNFFLKFWVIILLFTRDMILIVIVNLISYAWQLSQQSVRLQSRVLSKYLVRISQLPKIFFFLIHQTYYFPA